MVRSVFALLGLVKCCRLRLRGSILLGLDPPRVSDRCGQSARRKHGHGLRGFELRPALKFLCTALVITAVIVMVMVIFQTHGFEPNSDAVRSSEQE